MIPSKVVKQKNPRVSLSSASCSDASAKNRLVRKLAKPTVENLAHDFENHLKEMEAAIWAVCEKDSLGREEARKALVFWERLKVFLNESSFHADKEISVGRKRLEALAVRLLMNRAGGRDTMFEAGELYQTLLFLGMKDSRPGGMFEQENYYQSLVGRCYAEKIAKEKLKEILGSGLAETSLSSVKNPRQENKLCDQKDVCSHHAHYSAICNGDSFVDHWTKCNFYPKKGVEAKRKTAK